MPDPAGPDVTHSDSPMPPADGAGVPFAAVGTAAHVRQSLERMAAALQGADGRQAGHSRPPLARAGRPPSDPNGGGRAAAGPHREALRDSVRAYARQLRAEAVPPQRMLVLVKGEVAAAAPGACDGDDRRTLLEDVVRWSIDAYYAT